MQMTNINDIGISSLEIADMTGKRHGNVLTDIRTMLNGLEIDELKFQSIYLDTNNRDKPMFVLPQREALILASGYDVKLRAKIIDRLQELEDANQKPLTKTQMLLQQVQAMVDAENRIEVLEEENKHLTIIAEDTIGRLEAIEVAVDHFTISGYCRLNKIKLPLEKSRKMGVKATSYCKKNNIETGDVPEGRWGTVNTYPLDVLEKLFPRNPK